MTATGASANTTGSPRPVVESVARQVSWLTTGRAFSAAIPFAFPRGRSGCRADAERASQQKGYRSFTVAGAARA